MINRSRKFARIKRLAKDLAKQNNYLDALLTYKDALDIAEDEQVESTVLEMLDLILAISGRDYSKVIEILEALLPSTNDGYSSDQIQTHKHKEILKQIAQAFGAQANVAAALNILKTITKSRLFDPEKDKEISFKLISCLYRLNKLEEMQEELTKLDHQHLQLFGINEDCVVIDFKNEKVNHFIKFLNTLSGDHSIFGSTGAEFVNQLHDPNYVMNLGSDIDIISTISVKDFEEAIKKSNQCILIKTAEEFQKLATTPNKFIIKKSDNNNVNMYTCKVDNAYFDIIVNYQKEDIFSLDYTFITNQIKTKTGKIVDPLLNQCKQDVKNKTLRMIGLEILGVKEDPRQVLRAIKFIARGYTATPSLLHALKNFQLDPNLSAEKIKSLCRSFSKMFTQETTQSYLTVCKNLGLENFREQLFQLSLGKALKSEEEQPSTDLEEIIQEFKIECAESVDVEALQQRFKKLVLIESEQRTEISNLKNENSELCKQTQSDQELIQQLRNQLSTLEKDCHDSNMSSKNLAQENQHLKNLNTNIEKEKQQLQQKITNTENKLKKSEEELSSSYAKNLEKKTQELKTKTENEKNKLIEKHTQSIQTLKDKIALLENENKNLIKEKNIYINDYTKSSKQLQETASQQHQRFMRLQITNDALREEITQIDKKLEEKEEEIVRLKNMIKKMLYDSLPETSQSKASEPVVGTTRLLQQRLTASANEEDGKILAVFEKIAKDSNKSLNEHFYPDVSEFQTQLKNLYEEGNIANKPHLLPAYNKLTRNLEEIAKLTASSSSIRETTNSQHVQTFQYGDQTEIKKTEQELNQRQQSSKSVARKNRKK